MTMRPESALSDVLKHAEHGSVEEFVTALTLARLDLKSAMDYGLAYDFDAAKQYLRVLVLNQRRDILDWLLVNGEIVRSVARDVLAFGYEQSSVSFLLWLHTRMNSYFRTDAFIDFNKAMTHGSVEIASYLMNNFPQIVKQLIVSEIHPNAAEFWRNECWPFFLETLFERRVNPLSDLIACEDVSPAMYALTHGFLSRGMELPTEQKVAYITFASGPASKNEPDNNFTTWLNWCVNNINTAIKYGHWSCAKLIITALQETLPDHFPFDKILYFRIDNLERMDEKDMSEMVEWSIHCLNTLLLSQYPTIASNAPAEARAITTQQGNIGNRHDARRVIASAFVATIDCDVQSARKALLENETLALVIKAQLASFRTVDEQVRKTIVGGTIQKTSTIETLVEYGAHPQYFRNFTNIMQVWDKGPVWIERFILGPSRFGRTQTETDEEVKSLIRNYDAPFSLSPYMSMSDEQKVQALQWLSKSPFGTDRYSTSGLEDCFGEILRNTLVTSRNIVDFLPSEGRVRHCLAALRMIAGYHHDAILKRPQADVEDIINALLEHVPLVKDIFPLAHDTISSNIWLRSYFLPLSYFSTFDEAQKALLAQSRLSPSIGLVLVVKAHVKRLEAQLKALENDHRHDHMQHDDSVEQKSAQESPASSANISLRIRARKKDDYCKLIDRYSSLGFVLAADILDFNSARWFCDEARKAVAPEFITALYPGFIPTILQGCISNRKLFYHVRTCLGVAHTPRLYLEVMATQPVAPVLRDHGTWSIYLHNAARLKLVVEVDNMMRSIAAAIIGMCRELGCDITADAYKEALVYTHKCIWAYAGFTQNEARPTSQVNFLQVSSIDIAAVLMIEALDDAVNNSTSTCVQSS